MNNCGLHRVQRGAMLDGSVTKHEKKLIAQSM